MNLPLILIGSLLIFDTILIVPRSNINMGVLMPAFLGLPLLAYGLFFGELSLWFSLGAGVFVKWFIIGCYAAFIVTLTVCTVLIADANKKPVKAGADAIIVLGAGVHGTTISRALKNRLELAIDYFSDSPESLIVVSGGQGRQELISEAQAMKEYLLLKDIPEEKIITEDTSTSTYENFKFSKTILDSFFARKYSIIFVTNEFHVFRSAMAARSAGIADAEGLGCSSPFYIIPNYYLRETLAIVRYAFFGPR